MCCPKQSMFCCAMVVVVLQLLFLLPVFFGSFDGGIALGHIEQATLSGTTSTIDFGTTKMNLKVSNPGGSEETNESYSDHKICQGTLSDAGKIICDDCESAGSAFLGLTIMMILGLFVYAAAAIMRKAGLDKDKDTALYMAAMGIQGICMIFGIAAVAQHASNCTGKWFKKAEDEMMTSGNSSYSISAGMGGASLMVVFVVILQSIFLCCFGGVTPGSLKEGADKTEAHPKVVQMVQMAGPQAMRMTGIGQQVAVQQPDGTIVIQQAQPVAVGQPQMVAVEVPANQA